MDRVTKFSDKMVGYGTLVCVAGLMMIASIIFAAPGALLVIVGLVMVVPGLLVRYGAPVSRGLITFPQSEERALDRPVAPGAATS